MLGILNAKNVLLGVLLTAVLGYVYSNYQFKQGIELGRKQQIAEQSLVNETIKAQNQIVQEIVAKEISNIRIENKTIVQKATKEVITNEVYRDCVVPPNGVSSANEALRARNKTSPSGH